jgi:hypothetical protein
VDDCKPGFDWACGAGVILRWCPFCLCDSIISHGWRRKQAHDESHDWIRYRRGLCLLCGVTFSFLPAFSLPYTHYSLVARSQALRRRFVEHRSWESAAPALKDPTRIPDPCTLRRWFHNLDSSRPAFSFLRYIASLATRNRDGSIHMVAVWYLFDGSHVYVAKACGLSLCPQSQVSRKAFGKAHKVFKQ